ncbi:MAG: hypothetical protein K9L68_09865 [Spirochaetales bacterium]|nr:hypothetical protein [Spirochaetales bacterium]MCF7938888.1 hypothetical protein [Spirochaetales bacterium]
MKVLIAYGGKHGSTKEMAGKIASELESVSAQISPEDVDLIDLRTQKAPDPDGYDMVIAGGAVYMGSLYKSVRGFLEKYRVKLLERRLGLFLTCLTEDEGELEQTFAKSFPADLREHAAAEVNLGGRIVFSNHNRISRGMLKKVTGSEEDIDKLNPEQVQHIVHLMTEEAGTTGEAK